MRLPISPGGVPAILKKHALWLTAIGIGLLSAGYIAEHGVDFSPGQTATSSFCEKDLGAEMDRHGHSEEFVLKGCLVASDTRNLLRRFIPSSSTTGSCISCHDGQKADSLARLWTRFPKVDPASGEAVDLATAIRREIVKRYAGVPPNKADNAVTSLYFYMAAKAHQGGLTFEVETPAKAGMARPLVTVDKKSAEPNCAEKFDEKGWPVGPAAEHVVAGCNLIVNTRQHMTGPVSRNWPTGMTCQACHLDAGDKKNAASIADGAVVLPHMMTSMNQPVRFDRRILMCFARSMDSFDLGLDAKEITDINIYANWLAQKEQLPIGEVPKGRGIPMLSDNAGKGQSFLAGEKVFESYCMACHGFAGTGGKIKFNGIVPPPIAGPDSFNKAASTSAAPRLAGFIHANMPPGATLEHPVLTQQQALDVAAYLSQLGRPEDFTKKNPIQVFTNWLWLRSVNTVAQHLKKEDSQ